MKDLEEMMENLIPSKDVREYVEKTGRKFTDFEKAAFYYNRKLFQCSEETNIKCFHARQGRQTC